MAFDTSITVVIPCFNAGHYLAAAVKSVLSQTVVQLIKQIIVVDDGSTDPVTLTVLAKIADHPQVLVLKNTGPKGSAAARNVGVLQASSEWIAFLDADDYLLADSLERRLQVLQHAPQAEWIGGDYLLLDRDRKLSETGRFQSNLDTYWFLKPAYRNDQVALCLKRPTYEFLLCAPLNTIVTLLKRELFMRVQGYSEDLLRQQDYHLFLRLTAIADFYFVPHPVAVCRLHDANSTKDIVETQQWRIRALRKLAKLSEFSLVLRTVKEKQYTLTLANSYQLRREGKFAAATAWGWKAFLLRPYKLSTAKNMAACLLHRK